MSANKWISIIISPLIVLTIATAALSDYRDDSKVVKISGGEDYSLVLTKNNWLWACGDNEYYQLGIGDTKDDRWTLVRVHNGDMNTPSGYLEDINDMDAGWMHSLALDVNGFVWAWGDNDYGQLGDDSIYDRFAPVQVYSGDMNTPSGYLEDIIALAAGRSGAHSLAVDADNFVWAWGDNSVGQLGNGQGGGANKELTPVQVRAGDMNTPSGYLENIIEVSGGEDNSVARDANGSVWTWGLNDFGQLGNGSGGRLQ